MKIGGTHSIANDMNYDVFTKVPRKLLEQSGLGSAANSGLKLLSSEASKVGVNIAQGEFINVLFNLTGSLFSPKVGMKVLGSDGQASIQDQATATMQATVDKAKDSLARVADKKLQEAKDKAKAEIKKLRQMSPMSAEATVVRNYLDWILGVPWSKRTKVKKDIKEAKKILDQDHYGLEKVKERMLEYLAVQQRTGKVRGSILCLVGPPGVGKTSLGQSIAKATNRNFVRVSLGGVRDESEIRGHRRTYIGAMPGKIIQGMKKAKSSNPLFLLDEIDKLGADWRGDPSAALLEVLDPEQNSKFNDHYLELDYDLSDVMFICTANTLNMPRPLLDRMEIIRLSGYMEDEKLQIVRQHFKIALNNKL